MKEKQQTTLPKIFHIKIKNIPHNDQIQNNNLLSYLKEENFKKLLEQQYATKYLESINIEPNNKNITNILKRYPLENCDIEESGTNGGLVIDNLTITIHKNKKSKKDIESIGTIDIKKLTSDLYNSKTKKNEEQLQEKQFEQEKSKTFKINFNIENIKQKYLFPFNQNFQKRVNLNIKDDKEEDLRKDQQIENNIVFESKIFKFPFTIVKLQPETLKELQKPVNEHIEQIKSLLEFYTRYFPRQIFPIKHKQHLNDRLTYSQEEINRVMSILSTEEMSRLVGLFIHLAYWQVFGNINPLQIQFSTKKQIYITMIKIVEYFNLKINNFRTWSTLAMPMILLTLKIATQYLIRKNYPLFFEENAFSPNSPGQIALCKIFFLCERIFDQNNLFCRFVFLQTSFSNANKNSIFDRKFLKKRICATNPFLDLLLPHPRDGKARAILAKKHDLDLKEGLIEMEKKKVSKQKKEGAQVDQRKYMFKVILSKLQNKLEMKLGKNQVINIVQEKQK